MTQLFNYTLYNVTIRVPSNFGCLGEKQSNFCGIRKKSWASRQLRVPYVTPFLAIQPQQKDPCQMQSWVVLACRGPVHNDRQLPHITRFSRDWLVGD